MGKKINQSQKIIAAGKFKLPSPDEIRAASTHGGFTAHTLAKWGISWPPKKGWRRDLEDRWFAENQAGKPIPTPMLYAPNPRARPFIAAWPTRLDSFLAKRTNPFL